MCLFSGVGIEGGRNGQDSFDEYVYKFYSLYQ